MTSLSTNYLAFPGNFSPLTERRTSIQSWANALRPYLSYVHVVSDEDAPAVIAENGNEVTLTLTPSDEVRDHWPLWTLSVYYRSEQVEYSTLVGNLHDVLVFVLREV